MQKYKNTVSKIQQQNNQIRARKMSTICRCHLKTKDARIDGNKQIVIKTYCADKCLTFACMFFFFSATSCRSHFQPRSQGFSLEASREKPWERGCHISHKAVRINIPSRPSRESQTRDLIPNATALNSKVRNI